MTMYELKDPGDKYTYALIDLAEGTLSQAEVDSVIEHLVNQGIEDWNVNDICDELSKRDYDVTMLEVPEEIWI